MLLRCSQWSNSAILLKHVEDVIGANLRSILYFYTGDHVGDHDVYINGCVTLEILTRNTNTFYNLNQLINL